MNYLASFITFLNILFVVFTIWLLMLLGKRSKMKRSDALCEAGKKIGLSYHLEPVEGFQAIFPAQFEESWGKARNVSQFLEGKRKEREIIIFECGVTFLGYSGDSTIYTTNALFKLKKQLPKFTISPRYKPVLFDALIKKYYYKRGIRFPENLEFEKAFEVKGPDEPNIRQVLTPDVMRAFLALPKKWCIETNGYYALVYRRATFRVIQPEMLSEFINELETLMDCFS